ncbi:MAG: hypothetical protein WCA35_24630, partial [Kovacikia sp.]
GSRLTLITGLKGLPNFKGNWVQWLSSDLGRLDILTNAKGGDRWLRHFWLFVIGLEGEVGLEGEIRQFVGVGRDRQQRSPQNKKWEWQ